MSRGYGWRGGGLADVGSIVLRQRFTGPSSSESVPNNENPAFSKTLAEAKFDGDAFAEIC